MARNVEIKAKARDWQRQLKLAIAIADRGPKRLQQQDHFFKVPEGRLKLRIFDPHHAELIAYNRVNQHGPKTSHYHIAPVQEPAQMKATLESVLPLIGSVVKVRDIFWKDRTRIHLDKVEGLGQFLELEVVLNEDATQAAGQQEAQDIMRLLEIQAEDLIDVAYIDLLKT